jgi:hypothetical protein
MRSNANISGNLSVLGNVNIEKDLYVTGNIISLNNTPNIIKFYANSVHILAVSASTYVTIEYNDVYFNTNGNIFGLTNTNSVSVNKPGYYDVKVRVRCSNNSTPFNVDILSSSDSNFSSSTLETTMMVCTNGSDPNIFTGTTTLYNNSPITKYYKFSAIGNSNISAIISNSDTDGVFRKL